MGSVVHSDKSCQRSFRALGTINAILIQGCDDEPLLTKAINRVLELDDQLSAFKPRSEISRINASAGKDYVEISTNTLALLKRAVYFSEISDGAFDITARPLIELWGIGKKRSYVPPDDEIEKIKALVDYRSLLLDEVNCKVKLKYPGQALDLGGIAKGYAADEAKKVLIENHVEHALINLGGNIITLGTRIDGEPWNVGIQNPIAPTGEYVGAIKACNKTVVTSGTNERFFIKDGRRYHHILDPRTGRPAKSSLLSVTAVGDCSMDMDALTTALFVLGVERGLPLLVQLHAQAVFVNDHLDIYATPDLKIKPNSNIETR
jgi:thiamine biosynthesis lipoprotein